MAGRLKIAGTVLLAVLALVATVPYLLGLDDLDPLGALITGPMGLALLSVAATERRPRYRPLPAPSPDGAIVLRGGGRVWLNVLITALIALSAVGIALVGPLVLGVVLAVLLGGLAALLAKRARIRVTLTPDGIAVEDWTRARARWDDVEDLRWSGGGIGETLVLDVHGAPEHTGSPLLRRLATSRGDIAIQVGLLPHDPDEIERIVRERWRSG